MDAARRVDPRERQFLQPVFGIAASAAMFGDRMRPPFVAELVLFLVGVGLAIS